MVRRFLGCFFLVMGGVNVGIVFADAQTYGHFADAAYLGFVTSQWRDVVMANPTTWGLLLASGELVIGTLLLLRGTAVRLGWLGALTFHVLLMSFGPGIWVWSVPALALLVPAARADWSHVAD